MSEKKRLFIGTFLKTEKLLKEYPQIQKEFQNVATGKWVEEWNLHFTYHFIGEIEIETAKVLRNELNPFLKEYESEILLNGLGCFPSKRSPRVLFVKILENNGILNEIHRNCAKILNELNFEVERREFHPHLTLLRIKTYKIGLFQKNIEKYENFDFGKVNKFNVDLIESKLTKEGPIYKVYK